MNHYLISPFNGLSDAQKKIFVGKECSRYPEASRHAIFIKLALNDISKNKLVSTPDSEEGLIRVCINGRELETRILDITKPNMNFAFTELLEYQHAFFKVQKDFEKVYGLSSEKLDKTCSRLEASVSSVALVKELRRVTRDNRLSTAQETYRKLLPYIKEDTLEDDIIAIAEWYNAGRLKF